MGRNESLPSVAIIHRLGDHHSSGHIRLDVRHSAEITKHLHDRAVFLHRLFGPCAEAGGAGLSSNVEIVFERDGKTV
jgi:hypothetical protein